MMSADAMENSSTVLFDSDGAYDDSFDDLSIDIGDIYAILDEETPQGNFSVSSPLSFFSSN